MLFGVRPMTDGGPDGGVGAAPFLRGSVDQLIPLFIDIPFSFELDASVDPEGDLAPASVGVRWKS
jgi:hypothetical protein